VYSILEGAGEIIHSGERYEVKKGDTYFIPAELDIVVSGRVEILKSYL